MDVVLNWIWQGVVVALLTAGLLRAIPPWRSRMRSAVAWTGCAALLILPAAPLLVGLMVSSAAVGPTVSDPPLAVPQAWWTSSATALTLWIVWLTTCIFRTATAMVALRRAKRQAVPFPADLEARLPHWRRVRNRGRHTRLVLSPIVPTAAVLGGRTPVIALAPGVLHTLDVDDLDRVIVHEWAHVQRYDDAAHAVVLLMRAVAGWHPAFWWLERQLRIEREVACDEMAVAVTGSAKAYATCLMTLAATTPERATAQALAAISASSLRQRVTRIMAPRRQRAVQASRPATAAAAMVVAISALGVGQLQVVGAIAAADSPIVIANRVLGAVPEAAATSREAVSISARASTRTRPRPAPSQSPARRAVEAIAKPAAHDIPSPPLAIVSRAAEHFAAPGAVVSQRSSSSAAALSATTPLVAADAGLWGTAADGGKAIAARSEQAAVATAGFFTRFSKRLARSF